MLPGRPCNEGDLLPSPVRDASLQALGRKFFPRGGFVCISSLGTKGFDSHSIRLTHRPGWDDSKSIGLSVAKNWTVRVRFKHDAENLYFEFKGVKRGTERLFPEILIDPKNRKSESWEPGEWWLHVSNNLCEGNGEPNVYTRDGVFQCGHTKPGWSGNNPPGADTEVVEVRISFAKLGLNATVGTRFGIAFDMTDATGDEKQRWFFWPRGATLESPKSWGDAVLE